MARRQRVKFKPAEMLRGHALKNRLTFRQEATIFPTLKAMVAIEDAIDNAPNKELKVKLEDNAYFFLHRTVQKEAGKGIHPGDVKRAIRWLNRYYKLRKIWE